MSKTFTLDRNLLNTTAYSWIGVPYKIGGDSRDGIDCSHYVNKVYQESGFPFPYTTTSKWREEESATNFTKIEAKDVQFMDVIIFDSLDGSLESYGHAGLFIENNKFLGAQSKGVGEANFCDINSEPTCGKYWGKERKVFGYYRYDPFPSQNDEYEMSSSEIIAVITITIIGTAIAIPLFFVILYFGVKIVGKINSGEAISYVNMKKDTQHQTEQNLE